MYIAGLMSCHLVCGNHGCDVVVGIYQLWVVLRMVPNFVTVHTFWTSRDTKVSYVWCLLNTGWDIFMWFKTKQRKKNSASVLGIQNENLGQPCIFHSEIIKLQFGKRLTQNIALYFTAFENNCDLIISKKCVVTPKFLFGFQ